MIFRRRKFAFKYRQQADCMNHTNWIENVERRLRVLHEKVAEAKVMKSLMSEVIIENEAESRTMSDLTLRNH